MNRTDYQEKIVDLSNHPTNKPLKKDSTTGVEKNVSVASVKPRMWIRYVDNTFVLWPHDDRQLKTFHQHLHPYINFIMEGKTTNQIQFLDVSVRNSGGMFQTEVYRKPRHTDRYEHYF